MAFQSGKEIERTWIVKEMPPKDELNVEPGRLHSVVQDYIMLDGQGELRTRKVTYIETNKVEYDMAIKIGNGMVRTEVIKLLTPTCSPFGPMTRTLLALICSLISKSFFLLAILNTSILI